MTMGARDPGEGESHVEEYGLQCDPTALTLEEKAAYVDNWDARREVVPAGLVVGTDCIVSTDLTEQYIRDREWESRPVDVVRRLQRFLVIDGHHRAAAAMSAGAGEIPVVVLTKPFSL